MGITRKRSKPGTKPSSFGRTISWRGPVSLYFTSEIIKSRKLKQRAAKPEFFRGEGKSFETQKNDLHNKVAKISKTNSFTGRSQRSRRQTISQPCHGRHQ